MYENVIGRVVNHTVTMVTGSVVFATRRANFGRF